MGGMVGGEQKSHGKKKNKWKKPRMAIRIDMTPMVDVAFLLLIFFMVTTVFRLPQAMEINLPPDTDTPPPDKEVKQSRLLTFRVDNDDQLFYNVGNDVPRYLPWDSLNGKIMERRNGKDAVGAVIGQNLIVIGKLQPQAPFKSMVNLLDQFTVDSISRYSMGKWDTDDDSVMSLAGTPVKR